MKSRILGILLLLVALFTLVGTATASSNRNFRAHLNGGNQVNPVDTQAQGQVILNFSKDGNQLHVKLNVANIKDVIGAHLHLALEDANGPVVLSLIGNPIFIPDEEAITKNGTLFEGDFTKDDLMGPLDDEDEKTLEDLKAEIMAGRIYINVHTTEFRGGEIRGQIR
ncbi:MAG: CHRD domain-containing protein [Anaerolineae bacterium]|nr:CHRD domain-containing protein [Anaerolineae bacterium]